MSICPSSSTKSLHSPHSHPIATQRLYSLYHRNIAYTCVPFYFVGPARGENECLGGEDANGWEYSNSDDYYSDNTGVFSLDAAYACHNDRLTCAVSQTNGNSMWSCAGRSGCSCHITCILVGDCCFDVYRDVLNATTEDEVRNITYDPVGYLTNYYGNTSEILHALTVMQQYGSCLAYGKYYWIIDKCPVQYHHGFVKEKCMYASQLDKLWDMPFYLKNSTLGQVTFKNMFCAFCHGYTPLDILPWTAKVHCNNITSKSSNDIASDINCKNQYTVQSDVYECYRFTQEMETCPRLNESTFSLYCNSFINVYTSENDRIRNLACTQCLESTIIFSNLSPNCDPQIENSNIPTEPGLDIFFAYKQNGFSLAGEGNIIKIYCGSDRVFDFVAMSCIDIVCPIGFTIKNYQCTEGDDVKYYPLEGESFNMSAYNLNFILNISFNNNFDISRIIDTIDNLTSNLYIQRNTVQEYRMYFIVEDKIMLDILLTGLPILLENTPYITAATLTNYENKTELGCPKSNADLRNTRLTFGVTKKEVILQQNETVDLYFTRFSISLKSMSADIFYCYPEEVSSLQCSNVVLLPPERFNMVNNTLYIDGQTKDPSEYMIKGDSLYTCFDNRMLNCSPIYSFSSSEFSFVDDSIFIKGIKVDEFTDYKVEHDNLFICLPSSPIINNNLINTLTDICLSISVLSDIILVLSHAFLSKLRNLHGKNIICFSVTLFLAQILFLYCKLATVPQSILPVISIIDHYFWLTIFSWISILAFDIAHRFMTMPSSTGKSNVNRFICYFFTAFGLPLVIVSVAMGIEFSNPSKPVGYGISGFCWMSKPFGLLYFYIMPVVSVLIFSLLCFLTALYRIEMTRRDTAMATKDRNDRDNYLIYFKLFLILGLTWILGIISSNVNVIVLSYTNSVINGLQGLFLTLCCLCNKRVFNMIKGRQLRGDSTKQIIKTSSTYSSSM